jgi:hypothetical protein
MTNTVNLFRVTGVALTVLADVTLGVRLVAIGLPLIRALTG